jgi:hypothetical protein
MAPARRFPPFVITHRIATPPAASGSQTTTGTPRPVQTRPSAIKRNVEGITIRHYDLWRFSCEMPDAPIYATIDAAVKTGGRVHSLRRGQIHIAPAVIGVPPTAISCLGAFRTPAARARGWSRHSGVRKPAQQETLKGHMPRAAAIFSASICC